MAPAVHSICLPALPDPIHANCGADAPVRTMRGAAYRHRARRLALAGLILILIDDLAGCELCRESPGQCAVAVAFGVGCVVVASLKKRPGDR